MFQNPVQILANIYAIASADGSLAPEELSQFEAIRQELKFKKSDCNAARRLVESGQHTIAPTGTFADAVKNVELMLRMAYADGDLDKRETTLILSFCKKIGIHQEQLNQICRDAKKIVQEKEKVCPSCGQTNNPGAKFCAHCGIPVSGEEKKINVEFQIPSQGIAVAFAESSAAAFSQALKLAQQNPGFQTCQKGGKTWYMATFLPQNLPSAIPLVEALSSIKNKTVYVNGAEANWKDVFGFAPCASQRETAYNPIAYCFGEGDGHLNPWGCQELNMNWTDWADWFSYGRWEKGGILGSKNVWRFDKKRIWHELQVRLHGCRFCPFLNMRLIQAVFQHMPDVVDPERDQDWDYRRKYREVPGAIKVTIKEGREDFVIEEEFWADGVCPKGLTGLKRILAKAFPQAGIPQQLLRALFR